MGIQPLRLDKNLVAVFVRKAVNFVFDGRAITRPDAFDYAGVHGRAIQPALNDFVGALVGVGNPAAGLTRVQVETAEIGHHWLGLITPLLLQAIEIHRLGVDARWRARFQPIDAQGQLAQTRGQGYRRWVAGAAAAVIIQTDMDFAAQKSSGCQHDGFRPKANTGVGDGAANALALDDQVVNGLLENRQIGLVFQYFANRCLVQRPVGLGPGRAYRRAFASVQNPKLYPAVVCGQGHGAAEGIDFLDQMAFANAADGRIAGHLAQRFDVMGQQQGFSTHARRRQARFGTSVAAADDDNVELLGVIHGKSCSELKGSVIIRGEFRTAISW